MVKSDAGMRRTQAAILDAAARVVGRRPAAAMADIADHAGVGRATLYRYYPTRESLLQGMAEAGIAELVAAFDAAGLGELPADRAIARLVAVFLRNGAKYAAVISRPDQYCDPDEVERTEAPIRAVIERGVRDRVFRDDLSADIALAMFSAIVERALWLTVGEVLTPEQATDAAVTMFLDGARRPAELPH